MIYYFGANVKWNVERLTDADLVCTLVYCQKIKTTNYWEWGIIASDNRDYLVEHLDLLLSEFRYRFKKEFTSHITIEDLIDELMELKIDRKMGSQFPNQMKIEDYLASVKSHVCDNDRKITKRRPTNWTFKPRKRKMAAKKAAKKPVKPVKPVIKGKK